MATKKKAPNTRQTKRAEEKVTDPRPAAKAVSVRNSVQPVTKSVQIEKTRRSSTVPQKIVPMPRMRNRNLKENEKNKLVTLALVNPSSTLEEIRRAFRVETGVDIHTPNIHYHLEKKGVRKVFVSLEDSLLESQLVENPSKLMKLFSSYENGVIDKTWKVVFLTPIQAILYASSLELSITINAGKGTYPVKIECVSPNFFSDVSRTVKKFKFDFKKKSVAELLKTSDTHIGAWKKATDSLINQKLETLKVTMKKNLHL